MYVNIAMKIHIITLVPIMLTKTMNLMAINIAAAFKTVAKIQDDNLRSSRSSGSGSWIRSEVKITYESTQFCTPHVET